MKLGLLWPTGWGHSSVDKLCCEFVDILYELVGMFNVCILPSSRVSCPTDGLVLDGHRAPTRPCCIGACSA